MQFLNSYKFLLTPCCQVACSYMPWHAWTPLCVACSYMPGYANPVFQGHAWLFHKFFMYYSKIWVFWHWTYDVVVLTHSFFQYFIFHKDAVQLTSYTRGPRTMYIHPARQYFNCGKSLRGGPGRPKDGLRSSIDARTVSLISP